LLHDNARPHTLLEQLHWEVFEHPPYSSDLTPSDFYPFLHLKRFLAAERFSSDDEVKTAMQHWVEALTADFIDEGIQKLEPRYEKCLNLGGDYVEK
jgi:histone-lysine N-methyltransferase SETMAR